MSFTDDKSAYKARVKTRFTDKTQPKSIKKEDSANSFNELIDLVDEPVNEIERIIDTIVPLIPLSGLTLYIINRGDRSLYYIPLGGTGQLSIDINNVYPFIFDSNPGTIPDILFADDYFYSIEPDGIDDAHATFLTASGATAKMANFTAAFTADFIISNGNSDLNIKTKNLIISAVADPLITQLQIKDYNSSAVIIDETNNLGSQILYLGSDLTIGQTVKAVVLSDNPNQQISIEAKNISGVLLKTQNFLETDPDNNLVAPVRITIL